MLRAACHCTGLRFEIPTTPAWVLDCNCTLCRRYGALWAYYEPGEIQFVQGVESTQFYTLLDHDLALYRCDQCGCITHFTVQKEGPLAIRGINVRMAPTLDPDSLEIRHKDNGHTGYFWTKQAENAEPSHHPAMPMPGPEDWR